jgi:hypothetical protein
MTDGREIRRASPRACVLGVKFFVGSLVGLKPSAQPRGGLSKGGAEELAGQAAKSTEYRGPDTAKGLWAARRIVWTGIYNALADPATFLPRAVDLEWD